MAGIAGAAERGCSQLIGLVSNISNVVAMSVKAIQRSQLLSGYQCTATMIMPEIDRSAEIFFTLIPDAVRSAQGTSSFQPNRYN